MAHKGLKGLRYVNLLRSSTNMQDTSTSDQKAVNDRHADRLGMIHAGDIVLNGVSGSKSFNRSDLSDLLERRRVFKNYDVLVVYDSSRLTRAGASHGFKIRRDFAAEGVLILSVMDPIPDGDFRDVIQTVIDTQNLLAAKKISGFVTRGIYDAVKNGNVERHGSAPIGIDREYIGPKGEATLRLRYLAGGRRQLIEAASGKVLTELIRGEQPTAIYLMNRGEKCRLTAGESHMVRMIRDAFRLRYREGLGYTRIARYFRDNGMRPLRAIAWTDGGIRDILLNPTYLGWSYFLQLKCGLFHYANADRPQPRENIVQEELEKLGRTEVPRERRPVAEMLKIVHPQLQNFIEDEDVKAAANEAINKYFADWTSSVLSKPMAISESRPTSRYFLRNVLREKHYNRKLCGVTHGKKGNIRDYICRAVVEEVVRPVPLRNSVRAEPIERAVLEVIRCAFESVPDLNARLDAIVQRMVAELPDEVERARLTKELNDLRDRVNHLQRAFTAEELEANAVYLQELRCRRTHIQQRLAMAEMQVKVDPAVVVAKISESIPRFEETLNGEGYEKLRLLVNTICRKAVIDLETMEVEIEVALPTSMLISGEAGKCLVSVPSTQQDSHQGSAHPDFWLKIASYRLTPAFAPVHRGWGRPQVGAYRYSEVGGDRRVA